MHPGVDCSPPPPSFWSHPPSPVPSAPTVPLGAPHCLCIPLGTGSQSRLSNLSHERSAAPVQHCARRQPKYSFSALVNNSLGCSSHQDVIYMSLELSEGTTWSCVVSVSKFCNLGMNWSEFPNKWENSQAVRYPNWFGWEITQSSWEITTSSEYYCLYIGNMESQRNECKNNYFLNNTQYITSQVRGTHVYILKNIKKLIRLEQRSCWWHRCTLLCHCYGYIIKIYVICQY